MQYISAQNNNVSVPSFMDAVLTGVASDGGILLPADIHHIPSAFINNMSGMNICDIAYGVATSIIGDEIPPVVIKSVLEKTFTFDIPLVEVSDRTYRLELFHGPMRTHKDIGAGFMSHLIGDCAHIDASRPLMLITSVGRETAKSVAAAFSDMPQVRNVLVFSRGSLGKELLRELHGCAPNIVPVELNADRHRCEAMVRQAVCDAKINGRYTVTTANAVNPAIVLVRVFFFYLAYARLICMRQGNGYTGDNATGSGVVFVIPDSNPAMFTAARIASDMGLPIKRTIIMPESKIAQYGRFLEEDELGVTLATFPARLSSADVRLAGSGHILQATIPALRKFLMSADCIPGV